MRSFLTIFTLLTSAMLTSALVARAGPSGTPCSAYSCPAMDTANDPLGSHGISGNFLWCYYGASLTDCVYNETTGAAMNSNVLCPSTAVCSTSSRRDALPRSPRWRNSARQVDTSKLRTRNQLGAAKRGKRQV